MIEWRVRKWAAQQYMFKTSKDCWEKFRRKAEDKELCYDPMTHEVHQCKKDLCPLIIKKAFINT